MPRMPTRPAALVCLGLFFAACQDNAFVGSSSASRDSRGAPAPGDGSDEPTSGREREDSALPGSGDGTEETVVDGRRRRQIFPGAAAAASRSIDIIFAMDTSGSMSDEKSNLEATMAQFIAKFEVNAAQLDYRVFMIGEDFNFPGTGDKITKVEEEVDSHNALEVLKDFLDGELEGAAAVRQESQKQIVVVTDDDAEEVTSGDFRDFIKRSPALNGKTTVNGFVGLANSVENSSCELADVGKEYIALGADRELGGLIQDLCSKDWSPLLQGLADRIIHVAARRDFKLKQAADTTAPIVIEVDGKVVGQSVASYVKDQQAIVFNEAFKPTDSSDVSVTYTPQMP